MWPDLIQKAKDGGLDVIQTYVFWNGHEPSPGKVILFLISNRIEITNIIILDIDLNLWKVGVQVVKLSQNTIMKKVMFGN